MGGREGIEVERERLEAFELVEGVAIVALGRIDGALEAAERAVAGVEGVAEWGVGAEIVGALQVVDPDLGFGGGESRWSGPGYRRGRARREERCGSAGSTLR